MPEPQEVRARILLQNAGTGGDKEIDTLAMVGVTHREHDTRVHRDAKSLAQGAPSRLAAVRGGEPVALEYALWTHQHAAGLQGRIAPKSLTNDVCGKYHEIGVLGDGTGVAVQTL